MIAKWTKTTVALMATIAAWTMTTAAWMMTTAAWTTMTMAANCGGNDDN